MRIIDRTYNAAYRVITSKHTLFIGAVAACGGAAYLLGIDAYSNTQDALALVADGNNAEAVAPTLAAAGEALGVAACCAVGVLAVDKYEDALFN